MDLNICNELCKSSGRKQGEAGASAARVFSTLSRVPRESHASMYPCPCLRRRSEALHADLCRQRRTHEIGLCRAFSGSHGKLATQCSLFQLSLPNTQHPKGARCPSRESTSCGHLTRRSLANPSSQFPSSSLSIWHERRPSCQYGASRTQSLDP